MEAQKALQAMWRWVYSYILAQLFLIVIGLIAAALPFFPQEIFPETVKIVGLSIPIRMYVSTLVIPAIVRALDKYKYEQSKAKALQQPTEEKGLPGFQLLG